MKIQFDTGPAGRNYIRSYGPGRVAINQQTYTRSLIVTPSRVVADWPPQAFADLAGTHFATLLAFEPEVIVLGTGTRLRFPSPAVTAALAQANIGLEVMDTGAACRTYNVLMGDGRRVLAALLMIENGRE